MEIRLSRIIHVRVINKIVRHRGGSREVYNSREEWEVFLVSEGYTKGIIHIQGGGCYFQHTTP